MFQSLQKGGCSISNVVNPIMNHPQNHHEWVIIPQLVSQIIFDITGYSFFMAFSIPRDGLGCTFARTG